MTQPQASPESKSDVHPSSTLRQEAEPAGDSLVLLETGEYSDHSVSGPFKALRVFTFREALEAFKEQFVPEPHAYRSNPGPCDFADWLIRAGYIEDLPCAAVHIGDYGDLELSDEALDVRMAPAGSAS